MILKTIGVVTVVIVVLLLRSKWRKMVASINMGGGVPSRIHLTEDINPDWLTEEEKTEIKAAGFVLGRAYVIEEMEGVCLASFFHKEMNIVGDLFGRVADCLSPKMRPVEVGTIEHPVPARIFLAQE